MKVIYEDIKKLVDKEIDQAKKDDLAIEKITLNYAQYRRFKEAVDAKLYSAVPYGYNYYVDRMIYRGVIIELDTYAAVQA